MRDKLFIGAIVAGALALAFAFTTHTPIAEAAGGPNLKGFPKDINKKDLKQAMKGIAEALGQQCDYCHDVDDMAKDTEHKEAARAMMRMTNDINKKHFNGKPRVRCVTCHNGKTKPK